MKNSRFLLAAICITLLSRASLAENTPSPTISQAYRTILLKSIVIKPTEDHGFYGQKPTGLDLSKLLELTDQKKDFNSFTTDHRYFQRDIDSLVKAKKTWALCAMLDHKNVDAKIDAARALHKLADPLSAPILFAAAKQNNYSVSGSESATLHSIYRQTLKESLEKITGLNLTPPGLKVTTYPKPGEPKEIRSEDNPSYFKEQTDFPKVQDWLMAAGPVLIYLSDPDANPNTLSSANLPYSDLPLAKAVEQSSAVLPATATDAGKVIERSSSHMSTAMKMGDDIIEGGGTVTYAKRQQTFKVKEEIIGSHKDKQLTLTYSYAEKSECFPGPDTQTPIIINTNVLLLLDKNKNLVKAIPDTPANRKQILAFFATKQNKYPLEMTLKPAKGETFQFGQSTEVLFTIKNISDKVVNVKSIRPVNNRTENTVALSCSVYGSVRKNYDEDCYEYSSMAQQETQVPFNGGFFLPGQQLTVSTKYRPLYSIEKFEVLYRTAAKKFDGTLESLTPFKVYIPSIILGQYMKSRYVPFNSKEWNALVKENPTIRPPGPDAPPRSVIIEEQFLTSVEPPKTPLQGVYEFQIVEIKMPLTFAENQFPAEKAQTAAAKLSSPSYNFPLAYSRALGGYVVMPRSSDPWLLTDPNQQTIGKTLPPMPKQIFNDIDNNDYVRIRIGDKQEGFGSDVKPTGRTFWQNYPIEYGDGMYRQGEFIRINKNNFSAFLDKLKERSGKLTIDYYYFKSHYYNLAIPENQQTKAAASAFKQIKPILPKGWSIYHYDDEITITGEKEVFRFVRNIDDGTPPDKFPRKKYILWLRFGQLLSSEDYDQLINDYLKRVRQISNFRIKFHHIIHNFDSYIPDTPQGKELVQTYNKMKRAIIPPPHYYTENASIWAKNSFYGPGIPDFNISDEDINNVNKEIAKLFKKHQTGTEARINEKNDSVNFKLPNDLSSPQKQVIDFIENNLPEIYCIQKIEQNSSPFYYEKANGIAVYLAEKGARIKPQYSSVLWLMPSDYQGRLDINDKSPKMTPTPAAFLGSVRGLKVYTSFCPQSLTVKMIEDEVKTLKAQINHLESQCTPPKGAPRKEVEMRFGKPIPLDPESTLAYPSGLRCSLYPFSKNATLFVNYDKSPEPKVKSASYLIFNPIADKKTFEKLTSKGDHKPTLADWQLKLKQMEKVRAEYNQRFVKGIGLNLSIPKTEYKTGKDIPVELTLSSTNKTEWFLDRWLDNIDHYGHNSNIRFVIHDQQNNHPKYIHIEQVKDMAIPYKQHSIKPGQSIKLKATLNNWYDLSKPGKYKIHATYKSDTPHVMEEYAPFWQGQVKSNPLTITIKKTKQQP